MSDNEIVVYKGAELTNEMVAADPERYQVLANGSVYDHGVKQIVRAPETTRELGTAQASALARKRWDAYREAAEIGVVEGASTGEVKVNSTVDAWQWIVSRQTELAGKISKGRDSTNAAKFVGAALDAIPDRRNSPEPPEAGATLLMSSDVAKRLLGILAGVDPGDD